MAKRWLMLLGFAAAALAVWATGFYEHLNIDSIRGLVVEAGWLGPPLFVALFLLQGMALSPGFPFLLAAGFIWSPWEAFVWNMVGSLASCIIGFAYARTLGRDLVAKRLPAKLRAFETRMVDRALPTVIVMRATFFIAPYAHWAMGLSPVSWPAYMLGSLIGCLPWVIGFSFFGSFAMDWVSEQHPQFWVAVGGVGLLAIMAFAWRRIVKRRSANEA